MKTSIKKIAALLMAGFMMASCIDTEVSPEVKAIREAQAAWLQAKADLAEAEAALKAVEVQSAEADLDLKLVEVERDKMLAQEALKESEIQLEIAVQALAKLVAERGTAEAAEYLENYEDVMSDLNQLYADRIDKQAELSEAELLLDFATDLPFDQVRAQLDADLAVDQAKLTAQQSTLAALVAAKQDGAAVQAQYNTAKANVLTYTNMKLQLDIDAAEATRAYEEADSVIFEYEAAQEVVEAKQAAIPGLQEAVTAAEEALADVEAELAHLKAQLAPYTAELNDREAAYEELYAEALELEAALEVAEAHLAAVDVNYDPGDAEYDAAEEDVDEATDNLEAVVGVGGSADAPAGGSDLDDLKVPYVAIQDEFDFGVAGDLVDDIEAIEEDDGTLEDAQEAVATAEENLANGQDELADAQADLAIYETAYAEAIADIDALGDAKDEAEIAVYVNDQKLYYEAALLEVLEAYLDGEDGINVAIAALEEDIEETEEAIQTTQNSIDRNEINRAEAEAHVEELQAELQDIEDQITQYEALAAKWLGLVESVLG